LTYDIVAYWDVIAEDLDQRPHRDFVDVLKGHIHTNCECAELPINKMCQSPRLSM
jgi:hypothetical protein